MSNTLIVVLVDDIPALGYLYICTGTSQVIVSAQNTSENGGVERHIPEYTYYCAEEPTSIAPATRPALIVEPGTVQVVHMQQELSTACEAEHLELLHVNRTSDMLWKDYASRL